MTGQLLTEWLLQHGGAILRYRTANELMDDPESVSRESLRHDLLRSPAVGKWLDNLGRGPIHHSADTAAENAMGKLLEFGLHAGIPEFDEKMLPFVEHIVNHPGDALMLVPFLVRGGYWRQQPVATWFVQRLRKMHAFARQGHYDIFLTAEEAAEVPKAWRGKPIYRPELSLPAHEGYTVLPTCYDWYAMTYYPKDDPDIRRMIDAVAAYAGDPRFQAIRSGYGWDKARRRCWAGGGTFLACANPERIVLFVESAANLASTQTAEWFTRAFAMLEGYRTAHGAYLFPADLLKERPGSYYLYAGSHMGLTENRRRTQDLDLESTFRMLVIQQRLQANQRHEHSIPGPLAPVSIV